MKKNDAPQEYYAYLGFDPEREVTAEQIVTLRRAEFEDRIPEEISGLEWKRSTKWISKRL